DGPPRHAEAGECAKRGPLVGPEVPHRLVEADQPLLDQVVAVAADEEVRARLQPDEGGVAPDQRLERGLVAVARLDGELQILKLSLSLLRTLGGSCVTDGHRETPLRAGFGPRPVDEPSP